MASGATRDGTDGQDSPKLVVRLCLASGPAAITGCRRAQRSDAPLRWVVRRGCGWPRHMHATVAWSERCPG